MQAKRQVVIGQVMAIWMYGAEETAAADSEMYWMGYRLWRWSNNERFTGLAGISELEMSITRKRIGGRNQ